MYASYLDTYFSCLLLLYITDFQNNGYWKRSVMMHPQLLSLYSQCSEHVVTPSVSGKHKM